MTERAARRERFVQLNDIDITDLRPARCSAFCDAGTGPMPMISAAQPDTPIDLIRQIATKSYSLPTRPARQMRRRLWR